MAIYNLDEIGVLGFAKWNGDFTPPEGETDSADIFLMSVTEENKSTVSITQSINVETIDVIELPKSYDGPEEAGTLALYAYEPCKALFLVNVAEATDVVVASRSIDEGYASFTDEDSYLMDAAEYPRAVDTGVPRIGDYALYETLSVSLGLSDTVIDDVFMFLLDSLNLTDSAISTLCILIQDYITLHASQSVNWRGTKTISEPILLQDEVAASLRLSISEALSLADTSVAHLFFSILEFLQFDELITATARLNRTLSDGIDMLDSVQFGFHHAISEALSVIDVASAIGALINSISESLGMSEAVTGNIAATLPVSDSLSLAESVSSQGYLYNVIYETLHLNVEIEMDGEVWECYVLNTPKFLPSIYSGFDFNSYCVFENRAYGCKLDGIYELTGDTDNGVAFHTGVQLSETKFGSPNQKRFRKAYVGVSGTSPMMVMETEDGSQLAYAIDTDGEVDASRALKGKKWKLKVVDFETLEFIKLYPVVLSK